MPVRRLVLLMLTILIAATSPLSAAEDFSEGLLDRDAVIKAAADCTPEKYPNSSDVLVDDFIRIRYHADGASETWDDTYVKTLTDKGRSENKTLYFHFTLPYGTVEVKRVEVIKPDGAIVPVDVEAQSRVMIDRSQMGSNIYNPNAKVLQVGIPGLETGDMVHYIVLRKTVKPRMPDTWSDFSVLEWTSPMRRIVYEIHGPKDLPLKSVAVRDRVKNTVSFEKKTEGDTVVYRWEARDVPRMFEEPAMPAKYTQVQRLLVSTIPDWETISRWYWNLCKPHIEATTPEMKAKVAELTEGLDRQKKIETLFFWVAKKIRYMGITTEKEAPGYEPHPVKMTFEDRHGVCRDKGVLLVSMLRMAGIEAFPVIIHTGPKKDREIPQPYFNHAVVAVRDADGSYRLMDPTSETATELFPAWLGNKSYLIATPEGETLKTSPVEPATENMMVIRTTGRLDKAGDLDAETVLEFAGVNDTAYRSFFQRARPEQRREFFEGVAKRAAAGARLTGLEVTPQNLNDTSKPLKAVLRYRAKSVLVSGGRTALVPLPRLSRSLGMVNFIIGKTGLEERKYPFVTSVACGVDEAVDLEVDRVVDEVLSLPEFEPIETDKLAWKQNVTFDGGRLSYVGKFLMKAVEFSPKEYLALKDALKRIEVDLRKKAIVRQTPGIGSTAPTPLPKVDPQPVKADTVILDDRVEYTLHDAHTWTKTRTVKKRVVTFAGKQKSTQLKVDYNPAWEEVTLDEATVTAPDGATKTIKPEEINIMDAGWAGSAPRYPAGKTLVASLPGVDIGSTIEYKVTRRFTDRPFFAMQESMRYTDPIEKKTVRIVYPDGVKPNVVRKNFDDAPKAIDEGKTSLLEWTATDTKPVKREGALPPWWSFNPTVMVSTGDWPSYARTVYNALSKAAADQPKAAAKARELTAGKEREEAIVAIRDFVAKNIRAAGPGLADLPLSAITPADRTLTDGYGNSTDRAVLLFAMLKTLDVRPQFVLATGGPEDDELSDVLAQWPSTDWVGSVLVRVGAPVNKKPMYYYLNDTNEYARLGITPHDGRPGIVLPSGRIETIEAILPANSVTRFDIALKPDGAATITRTVEFHGATYMLQRKRFTEMPPEKIDRYRKEAVASISQSARARGPLDLNFDDYPGTMTFTVEAPRYAVRDGSRMYFTLPDTLYGLLGIRSSSRVNPLYRSQPTRTSIVTTVTMPEAFTDVDIAPALREPVEMTVPGSGPVRIAARHEAGAHRIVIEQAADLEPALIPVDRYDALLDINRTLAHPKMRTILVSKPEAAGAGGG